MTVTELKEFLEERLNKIEKKLDGLSKLEIEIQNIKFQVKILWGLCSAIILTLITVFAKMIFNIIFGGNL